MNTVSIHSKLPDIGTTIFTVMSQLAVEHGAVNLGQGFPDFAMSQELTSLVSKAMQNGFNQYVHMNGLPALREAIAAKTCAQWFSYPSEFSRLHFAALKEILDEEEPSYRQ